MSGKLPQLLDLLAGLDVEARGWTWVDDWDADLCATGIARSTDPGWLVYISVFKQPPGTCCFDCDVPMPNPDDGWRTVRSGTCGSAEELLGVLRAHLGGSEAGE